MHAEQWKAKKRKKNERKREKENKIIFFLLFPTFSIFPPRDIVYLSSFLFLFFILFFDRFACDYVYFRTYNLSVWILLENLFALHY